MKNENHPVLSSKSDERRTPKILFQTIEKLFKIKFEIDIGATKKNALCDIYIDKKIDFLSDNWTPIEKAWYWCNPPYSKTKEFVDQVIRKNISCVMLLPSRTGSKWFFKASFEHATNVFFVNARIRFGGEPGEEMVGATFPSLVIVFRAGQFGPPKFKPLVLTPKQRGF